MHILFLIAVAPLFAAPPATPQEKTFYALGEGVARELREFDLDPQELAWVRAGLDDALAGREPHARAADFGGQIQALRASRRERRMAAYLETAAKQPAMRALAGGVLMQDTRKGRGKSPRLSDTIKVHYHGTLIDGKVFDSSVTKGQPIEFPLARLIPCWKTALVEMKVGGKAKLVCPGDTAYGRRGSPPTIGPNETLNFEIELLDVK